MVQGSGFHLSQLPKIAGVKVRELQHPNGGDDLRQKLSEYQENEWQVGKSRKVVDSMLFARQSVYWR